MTAQSSEQKRIRLQALTTGPRGCVCQHGERYSQQLVILGAQQVLLSPQTQDTNVKNGAKRHREIKTLARGYPAGNWQSQDSNLERHPPKAQARRLSDWFPTLAGDPPGALASRQMVGMWVPRTQFSLERDTSRSQASVPILSQKGVACPGVLGKSQEPLWLGLELTPEPYCGPSPEQIVSLPLSLIPSVLKGAEARAGFFSRLAS